MGKVESASLLYTLLYIQSLGFIFHNGGFSSRGWVLLFFRACSSLIPLKMRERPPCIKHCKHFTQRNGEVIYSLQSVVSGFKAIISKEDHQAQSNKRGTDNAFFCVTVHNCIFVCRLHVCFWKSKCWVFQLEQTPPAQP